PTENRPERDQRAEAEQERTEDAEPRRREADEHPADQRQRDRAAQRTDERGGVRPRLEAHRLPGIEVPTHTEDFCAGAWKSSFPRRLSWEEQTHAGHRAQVPRRFSDR